MGCERVELRRVIPKDLEENRSVFIFFAVIISIGLLVVSPRFTGDLPVGRDSMSHLFKVLYLYKTFTSNGYIPSWCTDWYGGTPFLVFYPPLAYLLTFLVALLGLEPVTAYKVVEAFFYIIAPISVYFLSRELGLGRSQSALAGLLFSLTPVAIDNFLAYDRFTTIISVPILCLFLIAFRRALSSGRLKPLIASVLLLSTLILIHHLTAYYLGIVALFLVVVYYLKTRDAGGIFKRTVSVAVASLLLTAFWLLPFILAVFSVDNPFHNDSVVGNFITNEAFSHVILFLGPPQLVFAVAVITSRMLPSLGKDKRPTKLFRFLFPMVSVILGSVVSSWVIEAGEALVVAGFGAFFVSFFGCLKTRIVKEADFIFCVLWFVVFLWLGLGYYAMLYRILPFFEDLDPLRFTFYSSIPLSILAGQLYGRLSTRLFPSGFSLKEMRIMVPRSAVLVSCLVLILAPKIYFSFPPLTSSPITTTSIPQQVTEFFRSKPLLSRILAIRSPDWIYVLPYYTGKPIIDGWYPQEKLLKPLLQINDYQINVLGRYTEDERIRIWGSLIGNASSLGINWVMIGEPKLNSIMKNYLNFAPVLNVGNLTIYESEVPIPLVKVEPKGATGDVSIDYSSPDRISIVVNNVTKEVNVTVKEADFKGWKVSVDNSPISHSQDNYGFITFKIEAGQSHSIILEYDPYGFFSLWKG